MLALLLEYNAVDIVIGVVIGLIGGIIAAIIVPVRFNRRPSTVMDVAGFLLFLFTLSIALVFPVTMYLSFMLAFFAVWIILPFIAGFGKRKKVEPEISEDIEEAVASVSPEGRAAVLDQMGILPL